MANNYILQSRIKELYINIIRSHDAYLHERKSPNKIKFRECLEDDIKEYISLVPHQDKFTHPKFIEILKLSVPKTDDFNAIDAASAWLAISTYASNLCTEPWRTEYREIRLYSGFYKHHIEKHLCGAEALLELMGYELVDGCKMILKEPPNADNLNTISLNALIAMCECQVLFDIFREVSKYLLRYTYYDILTFREMYVSSEESAIRLILSSSYTTLNYCTECVYPYSIYTNNCCRKCCSPTCLPSNGFRNYHPKTNNVLDAFSHLNLSPQSEITMLPDDVDSALINNDSKMIENDNIRPRSRPKKNSSKVSKKYPRNSDQFSWDCSSCTFKNTRLTDICEMCGKSKNFTNDTPLISGGKECQRCTLVNEKNVKKCAACEQDLSGCCHYV